MKSVQQMMEDLPKEERQCESHGVYTSVNYIGNVWSRCPECTKEENRREEERQARLERMESRRRWESRLGESGIPPRFQDRTLDRFVATHPAQERALEFARKYADQFNDVAQVGRCALFVGRPGTGKTHLAAGIGLQIMKDGRSVLFTTVMRAVRRVKDSWGRGSTESESQAISALTYPDLLILDEVGVQFGSDFERNTLFDVLNERYEKRKPTILLSNLPKDELVGFLGERVFDRMREDGGQFIPFDWDSYRAKR